MRKRSVKWQCKFLSVFLAFALLFGMIPVSFGGTEEVYAVEEPTGPTSGTLNGLKWELTEDKPENWDLAQGKPYKLTVTGSGSIPSSNGAPQNRPWSGYAPFITSLSLGEGITSIGDMAFEGLSSLTSVKIPNSVTSIGNWAFEYNSLLSTLILG